VRAEALALLVLLCAPAAAQDMGRKVTFSSRPSLRFAAFTGGIGARSVLFESGPSDPAGPGDVIVFHGVSPDPGVTFQVGRSMRNGWIAWDADEVRRFPDGRFWARARLPAGAGALLLRAVDDGISADHEVEIFSVEILEETGERNDAAPTVIVPPARPPQPGAPRPQVHGRARWNARAPSEPHTPHAGVWRITLHHSDGRNTRNLAESLAEARFIQDYHMNTRKWIDIAYHFLIDAEGNVVEGRPEGVQGAHTLDNNAGNIGICLLGKYHESGAARPTAAQLDAVAAVARYLTLRYGIDPGPMFKGHRDYKSTDCPGDHAYGSLPALRRRADGLPEPAPPRRGAPFRPALPAVAAPPLTWN
jgi:hypothetical protein